MAKTILDILISRGFITISEAGEIRQDAKERGVPLEEVLYSRGIRETDLVEAKSELTGYPTKYLQGTAIPHEVLREIPEDSARYYKMVPLGKSEGYFDVGMLYPEDAASQEALKFISARLNLPVRVFIITPSDFQAVLEEYKSITGEITKALGEFEKEYQALASDVKIRKEMPVKIVEEAPVTKIVAVMLRHAVEGRASDIHIEPLRDHLRIRFRVDGVLHTTLTLPGETHLAIVSRIKVMSNMKLDETRIPQDGRFSANILDRDIDFRVSTFPTALGEKVVIRILDPAAGMTSLSELGLEGRNLEVIEENIKRPFGMILLTGPTGSGKTTTLYTILQKINQEGRNIVSLEDPVEYYIRGVNQSPVRPEIGYTFATGLRHILRQDPDVIMVGEIRDKETAGLAVHAALTGHLVLTTLHTNNAIGVVPRLIDMGIDPYLIPATVILAVAQRLVRRLCPDSRKKVKVSGRMKEILSEEIESMPPKLKESVKVPNEIYQGEVSPVCPKGTRGRIGVFEVLAMTPQLAEIVLSEPSESKIHEEAVRQEMITMRQDGVLKVLKGVIGLEELLEVV